MPKKAHFPGVNKVKWRDATYFYHRRSGIKLPDDYGSPAFAKAWADAEAQRGTRGDVPSANPRSYATLVDAFKRSDDWRRLSDATQADYTKLAGWMFNQGAGARPASDLSQERCEKILDRAVKELGWRRGLYVLQFNRRLYNWVLERAARKRQWGDVNPWIDLRNPARPSDAPTKNRAWRSEELWEILFEAPTGLRRAYVLAASGLDGSTIIARRWAEYRDGGFEIVRPKTRTASWVMVPPILRYLLEEEAKPSEFIATNQDGLPFAKANTLQTRSSDFLHRMAKAGKVGPGLTLHGLRHTAGKVIADGGGTLRAIQMALQHKSTRMALYYSEQADKKRALLDAAEAFARFLELQRPG